MEKRPSEVWLLCHHHHDQKKKFYNVPMTTKIRTVVRYKAIKLPNHTTKVTDMGVGKKYLGERNG